MLRIVKFKAKMVHNSLHSCTGVHFGTRSYAPRRLSLWHSAGDCMGRGSAGVRSKKYFAFFTSALFCSRLTTKGCLACAHLPSPSAGIYERGAKELAVAESTSSSPGPATIVLG